MSFDFLSFLANQASGQGAMAPLVAALADRVRHQGSEDLKEAVEAGDRMIDLLGRVYRYMQREDPDEAEKFANAARPVVNHYREHMERYLKARGQ
jgi:Na+/phosphate symporter